jgi:AraC-like DNA-binding protein
VVAYEVGYESEAAFNRAFRREYGAPPATWRKGPAEARRETGVQDETLETELLESAAA